MAELDKKIQKAQTDLVQAVLEAQDKKNQERVDMLVTNAIKQLKMSRFKPDQTTCLSLTYLARISPKVYSQSTAIKEVLRSLLRRDSGPANIKGTKNDIVLPVLAANILLACCDSAEVRAMIFSKIEQWLGSSQKVGEPVQHLLATLCMKCQKDQQTISNLIEMRHHWLQYLDENFESYGLVPVDLCANIRKLMHSETSGESQITYLKFLIKHDPDINALSEEISKFIIERPISFASMVKEEESGPGLIKMILKIYIKLFVNLKSSLNEKATNFHPFETEKKVIDNQKEKTKEEQTAPKPSGAQVKAEPKEYKPGVECGTKSEVKANVEMETGIGPGKNSETYLDENFDDMRYIPPLYFKLAGCPKTIVLSRLTVEAVLSLLALAEVADEYRDDFDELVNCLSVDGGGKNQHNMTILYEDLALSTMYNIPEELRQRLIHSNNERLIDLGLDGASEAQLVNLLQQFGLPITTLNKILKSFDTTGIIYAKVKDLSYFHELVNFYSDIGALNAKDLSKRLV